MMNLAQFEARRQAFATNPDPAGVSVGLPAAVRPHTHPHALSRRRLLQLAAGGAVAGAVLGSRLAQPAVIAAKPEPGTPNPIPGGSPVIAKKFGQLYHVYGPGSADPPDVEPATITDFNGAVGLAYPSGMVTRVNTSTGAVDRLPFKHADMRFMSGVYRGTDGDTHKGTFVFI